MFISKSTSEVDNESGSSIDETSIQIPSEKKVLPVAGGQI
jgi:hypothetical protein